MMKRHWLIMFWRGDRWGIPGDGDVRPGPYAIEGQAERALNEWISTRIHAACQDDARRNYVVASVTLPKFEEE